MLPRKRAAALLRHPLEAYTRFASVRFQRVIITSPDYPRCYSASLRSASVPFLSGGSAACSTKGGVGERIGMEWVFDKSFLDFSLYTYIFILLRWISRRRKCQQRQKGKAPSICALSFFVHIVPRRVLSSRPQK